MKMSARVLVCFAVLTFASPVYSNDHKSADTDPVSRLLNEAHDSLHSHSDGPNKFRSYVWEWLKTFDMKGFAFGTYRFLNVNLQNPETRDHALNLAFLLPLSHLTEMTVGPVAVYAAHSMGAEPLLQVALGAVGTVITLPGLDPLCLIFLSSYKFKPVQKALTQSRLTIYQIGRSAAKAVHLDEWVRSLIKNSGTYEKLLRSQTVGVPLRLEQLQDSDWIERKLTRVTYYRDTAGDSSHPLFAIDIAEEPSRVNGKPVAYVSSARFFGEITAQDKKQIAGWLKDFGANARNAVLSALTSTSQYHVLNIETDSKSAARVVNFRPFSLRQNFANKNCTSLLTD